jgi:hypothetical protein
MIAVLLDGTSRYFGPGSAICGVGFKSVTLDFEDCRPEHREWLNFTLSTRFSEAAITPRKIIEIIGPKMAYFEFPYNNKEQLYRIPYRSFSFVSPSPVELAIKADAALKTIRDALAETKGDGPAVLFWRTDTRYEINSVLDAETKEPNGQFQLSCRLGTYPLLDEKIWQSF